MKPQLYTGVVLLGLAGALVACSSDDEGEPEQATLQLLGYSCREDAARTSSPADDPAASWRDTGRTVGVAVNADGLLDPAYAQTVATEFNQLTPENEMKWEAIEPEPGVFDFT